jgi:hypothetical protein
MRVDNSTGKGMSVWTSSAAKFIKCTWSLEANFLTLLRIQTQFFERLQSVGVVDGAAHTQKDDVKSNGGSLECCKSFSLYSSWIFAQIEYDYCPEPN